MLNILSESDWNFFSPHPWLHTSHFYLDIFLLFGVLMTTCCKGVVCISSIFASNKCSTFNLFPWKSPRWW